MKTVQLPEVATINMGQSPPSTSYNTIGLGLPFFQGKTDFGNLYPKIRMFCSAPNKVAEKGDILLSVRAPVGPTNVAIERACIGRGLAAIRASSRLDAWYLLYFLRFYEPQFAAASKGSTFDAITRDDLDRIELPLPPLPEQQRIAGILSRADRLRRLRRYALEMSNGYLQSVFLEMFGDPATNPMEWKQAKIGDVVASSQYGTSAKSNSDKRGYPVLGMGNVTYSGEIDLTNVAWVNLTVEEFSNLRLEPGDIVFNRTNSTELVGKTAQWSYSFDAVIASYLVRLRMSDQVLPSYFVALLNTRYFKLMFQARCLKAVGQSNISPTLLKEFPMLTPPLSMQRGYQEVVDKHKRLRSQQREALRQAEHLFQTLLHGAFRGEV